jgi:hypothetical protein
MNFVRNKTFSMSAILRVAAFGLLLAIGPGCSQGGGGGTNESTMSVVGAAGRPAPVNSAAPQGTSVTSVQGRIVYVDQVNKLVTLRAADGKQVILHVINPYSLEVAKPGEPFTARFYEVASVGRLVPGETPGAESLTEGIVNAAPDETPGAPYGSQYQFAVTVTAVDRNNKTVSIKGLDGAIEVVSVANPQDLGQVQVEEQIVITLIDVVAVALDREGSST